VSSNRLFALAAAAFIIVLVGGYIYTKDKGTYEAVFSQDIVAGGTISSATSPTTSSVVTAIKVPTNLVTPGAFTSGTAQGAIDAAVKAIPSSNLAIGVIPSGTPVLASEFQPALVASLPAGYQLVSLDANIDNAVGGSLQVGNYVDVYATTSGPNGKRTILIASQIQIEAIHASVNAYNNIAAQQTSNRTLNQTDVLPTRPVPSIYILQVAPDLALVIANAQTNSATFYLTYVAPPAS
jgi:Flp pilus assembly protein CpaB